MWEFYLAASEMAFREQDMMVIQIQLTKRQGVVPMTRDYIAREEARLRALEARASAAAAAGRRISSASSDALGRSPSLHVRAVGLRGLDASIGRATRLRAGAKSCASARTRVDPVSQQVPTVAACMSLAAIRSSDHSCATALNFEHTIASRDRSMAPLDSTARKLPEPAAPHYRTAPHNIEAEQALLGAILVNNEAFYRVSDFLEPQHFFEPIHQQIYRARARA